MQGGELLAIAENDLRSHLSTARGFIELLRQRWDEVPEQDRKRSVERAAHQLSLLSGLLNDLLEIAVSHARLEEERRVTCDLEPLVREVVAEFTRAHPQRRIAARIAADRTCVTAERRHVERVLRNLLSNALRYSTGPVEVGLGGDPHEVVIAVRDQGRGIPEHVQRRLFARVRDVRDEDGAAGLGLFVCRLLVEAHGGRAFLVVEEAVDGEELERCLRHGAFLAVSGRIR
ncbi:MAG: sensor histidine kinase [Actinobacteria bacterium]|nr:sensor histidine kinase [Actinomycetota bacterium]